MREGSLEAPIRHPIDWHNPEFYDEALLLTEMERIFDICHGCRRCVNLCGSFPTLFNLVDDTPDGEVHGIKKEKYWQVVDQCYLCDVCYMTKCPYVPPHTWNVDFPHLMLRAKAVKHEQGKTRFSDKLLSATDSLGHFAGIPIVTQTINKLNHTKPIRTIIEAILDVDKNAWLPDYAPRSFKQLTTAVSTVSFPIRDGQRTPGKVAIYATCYIRYNEPGIGQDLIKLLTHNQIPFVLVDKETCCGMPKLELGDLKAVAAHKEINIPQLDALARAGYAILTPVPSCTLMFKQELPLLFPNDETVQRVKQAMWDPFEYFVARHRDGLLNTHFPQSLGTISYHIPCHSRVQNIGKKTAEMLSMVPNTKINIVERCSGHSGTWGIKKTFHKMAMKIGKPVFRNMAEPEPDYISSDCQLAGHHIAQGIAQTNLKQAPLVHPLTLLTKAYNI
jgi:glycerol-3-phosphate dehydrogenase subunit C